MARGPFLTFDHAHKKLNDGTINLETGDFYGVLVGATQALSTAFVGASGDCRYADLTNELATASGYTAGGVLMPNTSLSRVSADIVKFSGDPFGWTFSASVAWKYLLIRAENANDDLVAFCDFDDSNPANTVSATSGIVQINPHANGFIRFARKVP